MMEIAKNTKFTLSAEDGKSISLIDAATQPGAVLSRSQFVAIDQALMHVVSRLSKLHELECVSTQEKTDTQEIPQ